MLLSEVNFWLPLKTSSIFIACLCISVKQRMATDFGVFCNFMFQDGRHLKIDLLLCLPKGGGGYSNTLPIRVCAAQRGLCRQSSFSFSSFPLPSFFLFLGQSVNMSKNAAETAMWIIFDKIGSIPIKLQKISKVDLIRDFYWWPIRDSGRFVPCLGELVYVPMPYEKE